MIPFQKKIFFCIYVFRFYGLIFNGCDYYQLFIIPESVSYMSNIHEKKKSISLLRYNGVLLISRAANCHVAPSNHAEILK